jgi:hypothetical protein
MIRMGAALVSLLLAGAALAAEPAGPLLGGEDLPLERVSITAAGEVKLETVEPVKVAIGRLFDLTRCKDVMCTGSVERPEAIAVRP